jgi:hypothetical protein
MIGVQATAKSRRVYKMRGREVAVQGRPRHGQRVAVQLAVGDADEEEDAGIVRHKLPVIKAKKRQTHSLNESVLGNKRGVKKH